MKYKPNFKIKKKKDQLKELQWTIKWVFSFYFKNFPVPATIYTICSILIGSKGLVYAYFIGKIIDEIINLASKASQLSELYPYLIFLLVYTIIADNVLSRVRNYATRCLYRRGNIKLDQTFYYQMYSLGIQSLEDPDFLNISKRARDWLYDAVEILEESVNLINNLIKLIISIAIIYTFLPYAVPIYIVLAILEFIPQRHYDKKDFDWQTNDTASEETRKARNAMAQLQDPKSLQEIYVTGSFKFFDEKFMGFYRGYVEGLLKIVKERNIVVGLLEIFDTFLTMAAYTFVFARAIGGYITIGQVSFYMRSIDSFVESMSQLLYSMAWVSEFSLKMRDLMLFFNMKPTIKNGHLRLKITENNPPSVEFRNVYFKYPKSEKWIFENLNLKIESGERVALVGHNGAGKTTLIKLLSRFYDVDEGEILINGINIKDIEADSLYDALGVLFQEYNFYGSLTLKENILLGDIKKEGTKEELDRVAKQSDIASLVEEYKNGYEQMMSEKYKGGTRPSTGQQQKITIARFFYRNAPLAIFDEPTSAIDAVAEYKIFNEIYEYFKNKTVIIVSHRFSTVRNADRIIVLNNGKLAEQGTHEELLAKGRIYAHAFKLQAEGYR